MGEQRDLLPWIFGGLSTAAVAMAIALTSANRAAPSSRAAPEHTPPMVAAAIAPATARPAPLPAPAPLASAATAPDLAPAPPPSSQIWECTTNGQKTFANRPCGANAILREVGPVNGMDPTPRLAQGRRYYPQPGESPDYPDQDSSESAPEYSDGAYPVLVGIAPNERRRATHTHPPPKHVRAPPARKY